MALRPQLQSNRHELKYIIDESCAADIRDFVRPHLVADQYAACCPANRYPVHSLYLDSAGMTLYWQTVHGIKNRFKLRIRFYDESPDTPVFLEIKRRINDVILKERAAVDRRGIAPLLRGAKCDDRYLANGNGRAHGALYEFHRLCRVVGTNQRTYTNYSREAYVSPESNRIRVTFDRELSGGIYDPEAGLAIPSKGAAPRLGGVILELKFTDRFPGWMHEMVQLFKLHRRSVPKYIECVRALGLISAPSTESPRWFETPGSVLA